MGLAKKTWMVELFEATPPVEFQKTQKAATRVEQFGVDAFNSDDAKVAAREWLTHRGHRVRTVSVSADPSKPRTLIAYVHAGSLVGSRAFMEAKNKRQLQGKATS